MRADDYGYEDEAPPWGFGALHTLVQDEPEDDIVEQLYAVVEEVTGEPVERPSPRPIGFY